MALGTRPDRGENCSRVLNASNTAYPRVIDAVSIPRCLSTDTEAPIIRALPAGHVRPAERAPGRRRVRRCGDYVIASPQVLLGEPVFSPKTAHSSEPFTPTRIQYLSFLPSHAVQPAPVTAANVMHKRLEPDRSTKVRIRFTVGGRPLRSATKRGLSGKGRGLDLFQPPFHNAREAHYYNSVSGCTMPPGVGFSDGPDIATVIPA